MATDLMATHLDTEVADTQNSKRLVVLNISGKKRFAEPKPKPVTNPPTFDVKRFPETLSGILLKYNLNTNKKSYNVHMFGDHWLAYLHLRNNKILTGIYHFFCPSDKSWDQQRQEIQSLYKDKPGISKIQEGAVHALNPQSFLRAVREHFKQYKWNARANILEIPFIEECDIFNKLQILRIEELNKFINYLKFLSMNKV